ncbi:FkbM family methyltransferase [bacterium]|nr:FkbM family methyltransferase [bacterium]
MIKNILKSSARYLGLDVRRYLPSSSAAAQLRTMLAWHKINLIFDVGANVGQYVSELRSHVGYRGRIVSFEPMSLAHEVLSKVAVKDELWCVSKRAAIGSRSGMVTINIASNSVSSSVLSILDSHTSAAPESRYKSTESVPLVTLDSVASDYFNDGTVALLKIDTQGYESQVLQGAEKTLARVAGVQLELSLLPLYDGQMLMPELVEQLTESGFDLWGISPTFADPTSGRMLQVDATFFRRGGEM